MISPRLPAIMLPVSRPAPGACSVMSLKSLCGLICGASYTKGLDGPDGAVAVVMFRVGRLPPGIKATGCAKDKSVIIRRKGIARRGLPRRAVKGRF